MASPPPAVEAPGKPPPLASLPPRRAVEGRRKVPTLPIALLLVALGGGAAFAAVALTDDNGTTEQSQTTEPSAAPETAEGPSEAASDQADEAAAVQRIFRLVNLAGRGRTLVLAGDYAGAAANRRAVLARIADLPPLEGEPARAVRLLRRAMQASLAFDEGAPACPTNFECVKEADEQATEFKRRFLVVFNPLAERHLQMTFEDRDL